MTTIAPTTDEAVMPAAVPANLFVIPAYNEADNVPRLLADLEARPELFPQGSRLVLVDDGSADDTVAVARSYEGPLPARGARAGRQPGPRRRLPRRLRGRARRPRRGRPRGDPRVGHHQRPRRPGRDAPARRRRRRPGAGLGAQRRPDAQRQRAPPVPQPRGRHGRAPRARPGRDDGVLVLPRVPGLDPGPRRRDLRRRPDHRARLRLQGRDPRQAGRRRRPRRGGHDRPRRLAAHRREQDAPAPDHGRLRCGWSPPAAASRGPPDERAARRHRRGRDPRPHHRLPPRAERRAGRRVRGGRGPRRPGRHLRPRRPPGGPLLPRRAADRRPRHRPRRRGGRRLAAAPAPRGRRLLRRGPALLDDHPARVPDLPDPADARPAAPRRPSSPGASAAAA